MTAVHICGFNNIQKELRKW